MSGVAGDTGRLANVVQQFKDSWDGIAPGLITRPISQELLDRIRASRTTIAAAPPGSGLWKHRKAAPIWPSQNRVSETSRCGDYQLSAVEAWIANEMQGIFRMCTGAGKTITSLAAIQRARKASLDGPATVVVVAPTQVLCHAMAGGDSYALPRCANPPGAPYESIGSYADRLPYALTPRDRSRLNFVVTTIADVLNGRLCFPGQASKKAGGRLHFWSQTRCIDSEEVKHVTFSRSSLITFPHD